METLELSPACATNIGTTGTTACLAGRSGCQNGGTHIFLHLSDKPLCHACAKSGSVYTEHPQQSSATHQHIYRGCRLQPGMQQQWLGRSMIY